MVNQFFSPADLTFGLMSPGISVVRLSHSASCRRGYRSSRRCRTRPFGLGRILLRWTRYGKGQSRRGLPERMDAVARGIHSAVIREASALEFKPFAHPARQDAPSAMIYADLGSRVFFYLCLIKPFFAFGQLCMTRLRLSTALGRLNGRPACVAQLVRAWV